MSRTSKENHFNNIPWYNTENIHLPWNEDTGSGYHWYQYVNGSGAGSMDGPRSKYYATPEGSAIHSDMNRYAYDNVAYYDKGYFTADRGLRYKASISGESYNLSDDPDRKNKKCCCIAIVIALVLLVAGVVVLAVYFSGQEPDTTRPPPTTTQAPTTPLPITPGIFDTQISLNRDFDLALANPSSPQYQSFIQTLQSELDTLYNGSPLGSAYNRSEVYSVRNGSIVCGVNVYFTTTAVRQRNSQGQLETITVNGSVVTQTLKSKITEQNGTLQLLSDADQNTITSSKVSAPRTTPPTTAAPSTTAAPTTTSSKTTAPTTISSTTAAPTTTSSTTAAPTTTSSTTAAPTAAPTTSSTTAAPTAAPTTTSSKTIAPTTISSTTAAPTTTSSTTAAPTAAPTTTSSTTAAPTTTSSTTAAPPPTSSTTAAPTAAPTTTSSTTAAPTTTSSTPAASTAATSTTTAVPTTAATTTTAAPTTAAPTTTFSPLTTTTAVQTTTVYKEPVFDTGVKLNTTWNDELNNTESQTYKNFTLTLEAEIDAMYRNSSLGDIYNYSEVYELSPGSINCKFRLFFIEITIIEVNDKGEQEVVEIEPVRVSTVLVEKINEAEEEVRSGKRPGDAGLPLILIMATKETIAVTQVTRPPPPRPTPITTRSPTTTETTTAMATTTIATINTTTTEKPVNPCRNETLLEKSALGCVFSSYQALTTAPDMMVFCRAVDDLVECVVRDIQTATGIVCSDSDKEFVVVEYESTIKSFMNLTRDPLKFISTTLTPTSTTMLTKRTTMSTQRSTMSTQRPTMSTERPTVSTRRPTILTERPTVSTQRSTMSTERPTMSTQRPNMSTERPTMSTERPTLSTERPTVSTERPTMSTQRPIISTERPTMSTQKPNMSTERPTVSTERPTMSTQRPTLSTQRSTMSTERPTMSTQRPNMSTERPTMSTERPTLSTERPTMSTERPTVSTQRPIILTERPTMSTQRPSTSPTDMPPTTPMPTISVPDSADVAYATFSLDADFNAIATSGNMDNTTMMMKYELSRQLGVSPDRITELNLAPGSIKVSFGLRKRTMNSEPTIGQALYMLNEKVQAGTLDIKIDGRPMRVILGSFQWSLDSFLQGLGCYSPESIIGNEVANFTGACWEAINALIHQKQMHVDSTPVKNTEMCGLLHHAARCIRRYILAQKYNCSSDDVVEGVYKVLSRRYNMTFNATDCRGVTYPSFCSDHQTMRTYAIYSQCLYYLMFNNSDYCRESVGQTVTCIESHMRRHDVYYICKEEEMTEFYKSQIPYMQSVAPPGYNVSKCFEPPDMCVNRSVLMTHNSTMRCLEGFSMVASARPTLPRDITDTEFCLVYNRLLTCIHTDVRKAGKRCDVSSLHAWVPRSLSDGNLTLSDASVCPVTTNMTDFCSDFVAIRTMGYSICHQTLANVTQDRICPGVTVLMGCMERFFEMTSPYYSCGRGAIQSALRASIPWFRDQFMIDLSGCDILFNDSRTDSAIVKFRLYDDYVSVVGNNSMAFTESIRWQLAHFLRISPSRMANMNVTKETSGIWIVFYITPSYPGSSEISANDAARRLGVGVRNDTMVLYDLSNNTLNIDQGSFYSDSVTPAPPSPTPPFPHPRVCSNMTAVNQILDDNFCFNPSALSAVGSQDDLCRFLIQTLECINVGMRRRYNQTCDVDQSEAIVRFFASDIRQYTLYDPEQCVYLLSSTVMPNMTVTPFTTVSPPNTTVPPPISLPPGTESVNITFMILADYNIVMTNDPGFAYRVKEAIVGALRINESRIINFHLREGSIYVTFDLLPPPPGSAGISLGQAVQTLRNQIRNNSLEVYGVNGIRVNIEPYSFQYEPNLPVCSNSTWLHVNMRRLCSEAVEVFEKYTSAQTCTVYQDIVGCMYFVITSRMRRHCYYGDLVENMARNFTLRTSGPFDAGACIAPNQTLPTVAPLTGDMCQHPDVYRYYSLYACGGDFSNITRNRTTEDLCRMYHVKMACLNSSLDEDQYGCNATGFDRIANQHLEYVLPVIGAEIRPALNICKASVDKCKTFMLDDFHVGLKCAYKYMLAVNFTDMGVGDFIEMGAVKAYECLDREAVMAGLSCDKDDMLEQVISLLKYIHVIFQQQRAFPVRPVTQINWENLENKIREAWLRPDFGMVPLCDDTSSLLLYGGMCLYELANSHKEEDWCFNFPMIVDQCWKRSHREYAYHTCPDDKYYNVLKNESSLVDRMMRGNLSICSDLDPKCNYPKVMREYDADSSILNCLNLLNAFESSHRMLDGINFTDADVCVLKQHTGRCIQQALLRKGVPCTMDSIDDVIFVYFHERRISVDYSQCADVTEEFCQDPRAVVMATWQSCTFDLYYRPSYDFCRSMESKMRSCMNNTYYGSSFFHCTDKEYMEAIVGYPSFYDRIALGLGANMTSCFNDTASNTTGPSIVVPPSAQSVLVEFRLDAAYSVAMGDPGFRSRLIQAVAAAAGINTTRIMNLKIVNGSIIASFDLLPPPPGSFDVSMTKALENLQTSIAGGTLDIRDSNGIRLPVDRRSFSFKPDLTDCGNATWVYTHVREFCGDSLAFFERKMGGDRCMVYKHIVGCMYSVVTMQRKKMCPLSQLATTLSMVVPKITNTTGFNATDCFDAGDVLPTTAPLTGDMCRHPDVMQYYSLYHCGGNFSRFPETRTSDVLCRMYQTKRQCLNWTMQGLSEFGGCTPADFTTILDSNLETVLPSVGRDIRPVLSTCKAPTVDKCESFLYDDSTIVRRCMYQYLMAQHLVGISNMSDLMCSGAVESYKCLVQESMAMGLMCNRTTLAMATVKWLRYWHFLSQETPSLNINNVSKVSESQLSHCLNELISDDDDDVVKGDHCSQTGSLALIGGQCLLQISHLYPYDMWCGAVGGFVSSCWNLTYFTLTGRHCAEQDYYRALKEEGASIDHVIGRNMSRCAAVPKKCTADYIYKNYRSEVESCVRHVWAVELSNGYVNGLNYSKEERCFLYEISVDCIDKVLRRNYTMCNRTVLFNESRLFYPGLSTNISHCTEMNLTMDYCSETEPIAMVTYPHCSSILNNVWHPDFCTKYLKMELPKCMNETYGHSCPMDSFRRTVYLERAFYSRKDPNLYSIVENCFSAVTTPYPTAYTTGTLHPGNLTIPTTTAMPMLPNGTDSVNVTFRLHGDYYSVMNDVGFRERLRQAIANAAGVNTSRIANLSIRPGSIIVTCNILPAPLGSMGTSLTEAVLYLQNAITNGRIDLYSSNGTRFSVDTSSFLYKSVISVCKSSDWVHQHVRMHCANAVYYFETQARADKCKVYRDLLACVFLGAQANQYPCDVDDVIRSMARNFSLRNYDGFDPNQCIVPGQPLPTTAPLTTGLCHMPDAYRFYSDYSCGGNLTYFSTNRSTEDLCKMYKMKFACVNATMIDSNRCNSSDAQTVFDQNLELIMGYVVGGEIRNVLDTCKAPAVDKCQTFVFDNVPIWRRCEFEYLLAVNFTDTKLVPNLGDLITHGASETYECIYRESMALGLSCDKDTILNHAIDVMKYSHFVAEKLPAFPFMRNISAVDYSTLETNLRSMANDPEFGQGTECEDAGSMLIFGTDCLHQLSREPQHIWCSFIPWTVELCWKPLYTALTNRSCESRHFYEALKKESTMLNTRMGGNVSRCADIDPVCNGPAVFAYFDTEKKLSNCFDHLAGMELWRRSVVGVNFTESEVCRIQQHTSQCVQYELLKQGVSCSMDTLNDNVVYFPMRLLNITRDYTHCQEVNTSYCLDHKAMVTGTFQHCYSTLGYSSYPEFCKDVPSKIQTCMATKTLSGYYQCFDDEKLEAAKTESAFYNRYQGGLGDKIDECINITVPEEPAVVIPPVSQSVEVKFTLEAPITLAESDPQFEDRVTASIAATAGVDPSRITNVRIKEGSIIVLFDLLPPPPGSTDPPLTETMKTIKTSVRKGSLDIRDSKGVKISVNRTSFTYQPDLTDCSNSTWVHQNVRENCLDALTHLERNLSRDRCMVYQDIIGCMYSVITMQNKKRCNIDQLASSLALNLSRNVRNMEGFNASSCFDTGDALPTMAPLTGPMCRHPDVMRYHSKYMCGGDFTRFPMMNRSQEALCRIYNIKVQCINMSMEETSHSGGCNFSDFTTMLHSNLETILPGVGGEIKPILNTCKATFSDKCKTFMYDALIVRRCMYQYAMAQNLSMMSNVSELTCGGVGESYECLVRESIHMGLMCNKTELALETVKWLRYWHFILQESRYFHIPNVTNLNESNMAACLASMVDEDDVGRKGHCDQTGSLALIGGQCLIYLTRTFPEHMWCSVLDDIIEACWNMTYVSLTRRTCSNEHYYNALREQGGIIDHTLGRNLSRCVRHQTSTWSPVTQTISPNTTFAPVTVVIPSNATSVLGSFYFGGDYNIVSGDSGFQDKVKSAIANAALVSESRVFNLQIKSGSIFVSFELRKEYSSADHLTLAGPIQRLFNSINSGSFSIRDQYGGLLYAYAFRYEPEFATCKNASWVWKHLKEYCPYIFHYFEHNNDSKCTTYKDLIGCFNNRAQMDDRDCMIEDLKTSIAKNLSSLRNSRGFNTSDCLGFPIPTMPPLNSTEFCSSVDLYRYISKYRCGGILSMLQDNRTTEFLCRAYKVKLSCIEASLVMYPQCYGQYKAAVQQNVEKILPGIGLEVKPLLNTCDSAESSNPCRNFMFSDSSLMLTCAVGYLGYANNSLIPSFDCIGAHLAYGCLKNASISRGLTCNNETFLDDTLDFLRYWHYIARRGPFYTLQPMNDMNYFRKCLENTDVCSNPLNYYSALGSRMSESAVCLSPFLAVSSSSGRANLPEDLTDKEICSVYSHMLFCAKDFMEGVTNKSCKIQSLASWTPDALRASNTTNFSMEQCTVPTTVKPFCEDVEALRTVGYMFCYSYLSTQSTLCSSLPYVKTCIRTTLGVIKYHYHNCSEQQIENMLRSSSGWFTDRLRLDISECFGGSNSTSVEGSVYLVNSTSHINISFVLEEDYSSTVGFYPQTFARNIASQLSAYIGISDDRIVAYHVQSGSIVFSCTVLSAHGGTSLRDVVMKLLSVFQRGEQFLKDGSGIPYDIRPNSFKWISGTNEFGMKPGTCPSPIPGNFGVCAYTCQNDSTCPGSEKCCRNECGGTVCASIAPTLNRTCPLSALAEPAIVKNMTDCFWLFFATTYGNTSILGVEEKHKCRLYTHGLQCLSRSMMPYGYHCDTAYLHSVLPNNFLTYNATSYNASRCSSDISSVGRFCEDTESFRTMGLIRCGHILANVNPANFCSSVLELANCDAKMNNSYFNCSHCNTKRTLMESQSWFMTEFNIDISPCETLLRQNMSGCDTTNTTLPTPIQNRTCPLTALAEPAIVKNMTDCFWLFFASSYGNMTIQGVKEEAVCRLYTHGLQCLSRSMMPYGYHCDTAYLHSVLPNNFLTYNATSYNASRCSSDISSVGRFCEDTESFRTMGLIRCGHILANVNPANFCSSVLELANCDAKMNNSYFNCSHCDTKRTLMESQSWFMTEFNIDISPCESLLRQNMSGCDVITTVPPVSATSHTDSPTPSAGTTPSAQSTPTGSPCTHTIMADSYIQTMMQYCFTLYREAAHAYSNNTSGVVEGNVCSLYAHGLKCFSESLMRKGYTSCDVYSLNSWLPQYLNSSMNSFSAVTCYWAVGRMGTLCNDTKTIRTIGLLRCGHMLSAVAPTTNTSSTCQRLEELSQCDLRLNSSYFNCSSCHVLHAVIKSADWMKHEIGLDILPCLQHRYKGGHGLSYAELSEFKTSGKYQATVSVDRCMYNDSYVIRASGVPDHDWEKTNPNNATVQNHVRRVPKVPTVAPVPGCVPMGMIGLTRTGVSIYNPLAGGNVNAVEGDNSETFDSCDGHPSPNGEYHYHKIPDSCLYSNTVDEFVGVAMDGFPIYGPNSSSIPDRWITSDDLDKCHGSNMSGSYRYYVTEDFPYFLGCFRGHVLDPAIMSNYTCSSDTSEWNSQYGHYLCNCPDYGPGGGSGGSPPPPGGSPPPPQPGRRR